MNYIVMYEHTVYCRFAHSTHGSKDFRRLFKFEHDGLLVEPVIMFTKAVKLFSDYSMVLTEAART
jgi:hypothetical protein